MYIKYIYIVAIKNIMKGVLMASKLNYEMVCGITGEQITEWKDVTFITTYIKGEKVTIPLHINKWALLELHNASPTSKKSREEASKSEAESVSEDVAIEDAVLDVEVMEEVAPY